jgi:hypothetical protein
MPAKLHKVVSLNERATAINKLFEERDTNRAVLGHELLEAQKQVNAELGRGHWEEWCAANVKRSQKDIQKIMGIAASPDPIAAHEAEKAATRERMTERAEKVRSVDQAALTRPIPQSEQSYELTAEENNRSFDRAQRKHLSPVLTVVPKIDPIQAIIDTRDQMQNDPIKPIIELIDALHIVDRIRLWEYYGNKE